MNQYYCYLWDPDWGPAFIKISGYAPWGGRVWLNGHEWAKRQLAKRGIAYESLVTAAACITVVGTVG